MLSCKRVIQQTASKRMTQAIPLDVAGQQETDVAQAA